MASAADPLLVLYGSETGNARDVAERIAREAARGGDDAGSVHCLSMDRFEVTQLPTAPLVVCVCSTTGQGDPPANMRDFWRFLLRKSLPADSLNAVRFAVFGLGDSHYQKYNVAAKRLHRRLLALGARELLDLGLGDDQHPTGYEATLDPWLERLWRALGRTVGPSTSAHHQSVESQPADPCRVVVRVVEAPEGLGSGSGSEAGTNDRLDDDRPVRDVEARVRELCDAARELDRALEAAAAIPPRLLRSSSRTASSSSSSARAFTEDRPAVATVLVNAPLTAPDADAEVRHVEIAAADVLGAGEPPHRPGDCLAVSPLPQDDDAGETRAATIEVLRRAGIAPDAWVVCEVSDRCRTGVGHAYVGTPVRAMALVEGALDLISASPRRYFFETAATFASHPKEAERLRHFASKDGRDELWYYNERERRCVREFLEDFPSVAMPLGWMLTTAPRLRPRLFSIASAASAAPDAIHLTVTTVRWKTHYGRTRHGLCSNAVARVAPGSGTSKLACWLCSNGATFPPPRDDAPLVLVCTGSGVAPLRSLVQDRVHRALHAGARIAPTLVFFGCRREAGDFLYREEWEALAGDPIALLGHPELRTFTNDANDDGSCGSPLNPKPNPKPSEVVHLEGGFVPAFSRDGAAKDYVQHRIASHAMRVWRMLRAGAAVYVAGSAAKMPQDVRETMEKVVEACGGVSIDDARAYVRGMENGGRYVVEACPGLYIPVTTHVAAGAREERDGEAGAEELALHAAAAARVAPHAHPRGGVRDALRRRGGVHPPRRGVPRRVQLRRRGEAQVRRRPRVLPRILPDRRRGEPTAQRRGRGCDVRTDDHAATHSEGAGVRVLRATKRAAEPQEVRQEPKRRSARGPHRARCHVLRTQGVRGQLHGRRQTRGEPVRADGVVDIQRHVRVRGGRRDGPGQRHRHRVAERRRRKVCGLRAGKRQRGSIDAGRSRHRAERFARRAFHRVDANRRAAQVSQALGPDRNRHTRGRDGSRPRRQRVERVRLRRVKSVGAVDDVVSGREECVFGRGVPGGGGDVRAGERGVPVLPLQAPEKGRGHVGAVLAKGERGERAGQRVLIFNFLTFEGIAYPAGSYYFFFFLPVGLRATLMLSVRLLFRVRVPLVYTPHGVTLGLPPLVRPSPPPWG